MSTSTDPSSAPTANYVETIESSPSHHSESCVEIQYAPGLLPNGGGPAPPVIGYHAPKTSTLLHGLPCVPIAPNVGKKKRTKSAAAPSAARKKPKKQKTAADDLPTIDPDVEEFLENEEVAEAADDIPTIDPDVEEFLANEEVAEAMDDAANIISETREQTHPADPPAPQRTPSPPVRPTYKPRKMKLASKKPQAPTPPARHSPTPVLESSEHTQSAAGKHHIEEEEEIVAPAPAILVLADMFSFGIRQFMDEEEETTSKALVPLADDVKATLLDISKRLEGSLETLVTSCGSIRDRFHEVHDKTPDELADAITPAAYLEQHWLKLEKAK
nr:uncharacterized protein CG5098-like [Oryza sativa Japonica Group]